MFHRGSLQDGVSLAMREVKPVVCFVTDNGELSLRWEQEYLEEPEVAKVISGNVVLLRLTAGTQDVEFLKSYCPISEFPTIVFIRNGMLREYLTPEVSADDFRKRLLAAMDDHNAYDSAQRSDMNTANSITQDVLTSQLPSQSTRTLQSTPSESRGATRIKKDAEKTESAKSLTLTKRSSSREPERKPNINLGRATQAPQKQTQLDNEDTATHPTATSIPQSSAARGPPNQYRLQVRLFDGTSVRSSFSPQQTIGRDVRSWLDEQMSDNHQPYNLKHMLTPLPSRTFSISEESKALGELGLESTANLVMIPVQSYTEAYAAPGGSLPSRVISSIYSGASSVANTATGLVGSLFGYASNASAAETSTPASSSFTERRRRQTQPRPVIRTLRDQQNDRTDNQFYNGNQLNFEPQYQDDTN